MNFLDKLYESNYFGIGLFAVISFLVVTFLIVLFFGKRDEKRRLDSTKELQKTDTDNTFKETSELTPVEVPVAPTNESLASVMDENIMPVMSSVEEVSNVETVTPIEPVAPMINEAPVTPINFAQEPITPVAPINYDYEPQHVSTMVNDVAPVDVPISPVITEVPTPVITEPIKNVEPIRLEPTTYEVPVEPKVIEPIRITIPEEPIKTPVIDEVRPVTPVMPEVTQVVEPVEQVVRDTYYKPIEKTENEEIEVPSIDFDALAKSISDELDELENSTNTYHEDVKVTPIDEVVNRPATQFSSVYVNQPVKPIVNDNVDLPKKIDLPTMKSNEIEPENYNI